MSAVYDVRMCPKCNHIGPAYLVEGKPHCRVCSWSFEQGGFFMPSPKEEKPMARQRCKKPRGERERGRVVTLDRDAKLTPQMDGSVLVEFVAPKGHTLSQEAGNVLTNLLGSIKHNQAKWRYEASLGPEEMQAVRQYLGDFFPVLLPDSGRGTI